jgi:hypothetical protein
MMYTTIETKFLCTHCCCPFTGGANLAMSNSSPSARALPFLCLCAAAAAAAVVPAATASPWVLLVARGLVASGSKNAGLPATCGAHTVTPVVHVQQAVTNFRVVGAGNLNLSPTSECWMLANLCWQSCLQNLLVAVAAEVAAALYGSAARVPDLTVSGKVQGWSGPR